MDLLKDEGSDSNSSDEAEYVGQHDALETTTAKEEISVQSVRKVYLIVSLMLSGFRCATRLYKRCYMPFMIHQLISFSGVVVWKNILSQVVFIFIWL